ncbi:MAG TPA: bifunctional phosphoribosylaminoimidazolecarboxamide formyltransferase/IMP cyclohydrolase [bacterium]|nr:bifunctional phosphoribosylaminoimidazolecarboxamide formyltransferase/IMP cyclohydrolase [bacterium]HPP29646.1 bifunctional phosphoribosylaminoimidazolecarboxamide formyltransferase/IMP cyclohydrolase [bacterium]
MIEIRRAIISVSDKKGIVELADFLSKKGVEIISTGGTAKALRDSGIKVKDVSEFTGFPEILDGRVKTLHPRIYGGILSIRDDKEHQKQMKENDLVPIDLIVCNLYPFEETLKRGASHNEIIENIDIGGPTMIRAASKNYKYVCVLVKPELYAEFIKEMEENNGCVSEDFSFRCAMEVFRHTSRYDFAIASYFSKKVEGEKPLPDEMNIRLIKVQDLRYGENPHQLAAWYRFSDKEFPRQQFQGKELSFNNLLDMEATYILVNQFSLPACVIVKHTNPCGVAVGNDLSTAYEKALETDPLSAFGGIVGFNRKVERKVAEKIVERFYEVVIAPDYDEDALAVLRKKENLRVIKSPTDIKLRYDFKTLNDGLLVQTPDDKEFEKLEVVTKRAPDEKEMTALKFGWTVCKFVKSNTIVLATENQTTGIGAGQMSRYDSARVAVMKMRDNFKKEIKPLVCASDAFFPFPDSIDVLKEAGVSAIIQPGGALKDKEVIAACDRYGIAMVLTGMRHFKH